MTIFENCRYILFIINQLSLQETLEFCNFISSFNTYNQGITRPAVTTKVVIYYQFCYPISVLS